MECVAPSRGVVETRFVIVDAVIWSKAYRWKYLDAVSQTLVDELNLLKKDKRPIMLGAVRQEVLSGISDERQFESLSQRLS